MFLVDSPPLGGPSALPHDLADALDSAGVRLDTGDVLLREHPPPSVDQTAPADSRGNP